MQIHTTSDSGRISDGHTHTHNAHIQHYAHRFNYAMSRNYENIFTRSILRKMELSAFKW